jgi:predicted alpha/beta superfamily hydrolase
MLQIHRRFAAQHLGNRRDIAVWLPPGYHDSRERYPVFYLQDGQNLFDPATAFAGQDWRAGATADEMTAKNEIRPVILVGVYHTGVHRISEYTPTRDRRRRKGGKADRYARMLAREIKPFIDREYRTLKGAANAAVGGSSLGALASLMGAMEYPRVFGAAAVISPSVWWDDRSILRFVCTHKGTARPRIWLDVGTAEGAGVVEDTRALRDALLEHGWRCGADLQYQEIEGAPHSETAWGARFGAVLAYLFPATSLRESAG